MTGYFIFSRRAKNKAWANYKESGKTLAAFEKYRQKLSKKWSKCKQGG